MTTLLLNLAINSQFPQLISAQLSRMSMKRNSADEQGSYPKKRAPNFKTAEVKFFLHEVKKRKMILFGTLSPTLTFTLKIQTWLEVRNQLVATGFPPRTKEQLKKKWEDLSSVTKAKYAQRKKTGGGAIEWTDVDELITEILGKENTSLVSIVGGIDSGDNIQAGEHTLDASSDASEKDSRPSTSSYTLVGPDRMAELESGKKTSENKQEESRLREEQTKEPNCNSDTVKEQGHREVNIEKVLEQHLKEEHEVKMRILKKKEELLDLKLQLFRRQLDSDELD